jgi:hypothetical protein
VSPNQARDNNKMQQTRRGPNGASLLILVLAGRDQGPDDD